MLNYQRVISISNVENNMVYEELGGWTMIWICAFEGFKIFPKIPIDSPSHGEFPIVKTKSRLKQIHCITVTIWLFNVAMENHHFQ